MKAIDMNTDIRKAIQAKGLNHYEVATALGIANGTFAGWLQSELPQDKKERILAAIENYSGKKAIFLNQDIKEAMQKKRLAQYEVANAMGIKPGTFAHWLLTELSPERKKRVYAAIASIKA